MGFRRHSPRDSHLGIYARTLVWSSRPRLKDRRHSRAPLTVRAAYTTVSTQSAPLGVPRVPHRKCAGAASADGRGCGRHERTAARRNRGAHGGCVLFYASFHLAASACALCTHGRTRVRLSRCTRALVCLRANGVAVSTHSTPGQYEYHREYSRACACLSARERRRRRARSSAVSCRPPRRQPEPSRSAHSWHRSAAAAAAAGRARIADGYGPLPTVAAGGAALGAIRGAKAVASAGRPLRSAMLWWLFTKAHARSAA